MPASADNGYGYLQKKFREQTGIDLTFYKDRQMIRRLTGYLQRVDTPSFYALARRIERDDTALQHLKDFITINVTEFFRNPERFESLKKNVFPQLASQGGPLRIWSAGCSSGAEAYSLAIILSELGVPGHVVGTDIDAGVLAEAKAGIYSEDRLREVAEERRDKFFHQLDGEQWGILPFLKRNVTFQHHNLLKDPYPKRQHLILCRNVVIYFTDAAKEQIYRGFAEALVDGGYLLVGGTESILNPRAFGLEPAGPFLYRRPQSSS